MRRAVACADQDYGVLQHPGPDCTMCEHRIPANVTQYLYLFIYPGSLKLVFYFWEISTPKKSPTEDKAASKPKTEYLVVHIPKETERERVLSSLR